MYTSEIKLVSSFIRSRIRVLDEISIIITSMNMLMFFKRLQPRNSYIYIYIKLVPVWWKCRNQAESRCDVAKAKIGCTKTGISVQFHTTISMSFDPIELLLAASFLVGICAYQSFDKLFWFGISLWIKSMYSLVSFIFMHSHVIRAWMMR